MITGTIWLRVPETIKVILEGKRPRGLTAKDVALAMIAKLGAEGANYRALEFYTSGFDEFTLEDRFVFSNLAVEAGAKAAIFANDSATTDYLAPRTSARGTAVASDEDAVFASELVLRLDELAPSVAIPHSPNEVVPIDTVSNVPVHMVFLGTCTGGRVVDFHEALAVLERGGSRIAPGVQVVVTPASREVYLRLIDDGTIAKFAAMGAIVTTPGCGACCGTSGAIPGDGMNVVSTANRNFKARMGNATASIYLASPAACAAAAVTGHLTDPREVGSHV
jgi:3-isopropylmalate/(R)-2-methylmalate dehydratase large subunit